MPGVGFDTGLKKIDFYIDPATGAIIDKSAVVNPSGNITINTRNEVSLSAITTPFGDTLDLYQITEVIAEVYLDIAIVPANPGWTSYEWVREGGVGTQCQGCEAGIVMGTKVVTQTADDSLINAVATRSGQLLGTGIGEHSSLPCRIHIKGFR